jgi:DNA-binding CsgD family transcriptional regulator
MSRDEGPDHAAEFIGHLTRKPGSGVTVRTPRPARESLYSFDRENAGIPTAIAARASYIEAMDRDDDSALARLMDSLLDALSPRQREAVELVAIAGLTFGAAAKAMGTSKATLYAHYRDAIRKLRDALTTTPWAAALVGPWLTDDDEGDDDPSGPGIVVPFPRLVADDELDDAEAA